MDARLKVEEAGSRLGALRARKDSTYGEIIAAETALAEAQFEWAVEKAVARHTPSKELADRVCERLMSVTA